DVNGIVVSGGQIEFEDDAVISGKYTGAFLISVVSHHLPGVVTARDLGSCTTLGDSGIGAPKHLVGQRCIGGVRGTSLQGDGIVVNEGQEGFRQLVCDVDAIGLISCLRAGPGVVVAGFAAGAEVGIYA